MAADNPAPGPGPGPDRSTALPEPLPVALPASSVALLRLSAVLLGILVAVVVGALLRNLEIVFRPLTIAFFFSYLLYPIQVQLMRWHLPRMVAIVVTLALVVGVMTVLGQLVYASLPSFTEEFPKYERRLAEMVVDTLERLEIPLEEAKRQVRELDWRELLGERGLARTLTSTVSTTMGTFFGFLGQVLLVAVLMIFILSGRERTGRKIERALPAETAARVAAVLDSIQRDVQTYLVTKTLISFAVGALTAAVLSALGVDFPLVWGLLTFLLNFIPNAGSVVATAMPLVVSFLEFGLSGRTIAAGVLLTTIQFTIGYLVEPRVMGGRLHLSPLLVLMALIFWAYVWGIPGMILAVPITAALKISFENVPAFRPLAELMG